MNKSSLWFYSGLLGMMLSGSSMIKTLSDYTRNQRNIPQEFLTAREEFKHASSALRSTQHKRESPEYHTLVQRLKTSEDAHVVIINKPEIQQAYKQSLEQGLELILEIGHRQP